MKGNKGFTLVELIIVIVILGILGAMIIPRFAEFDKKARASAVTALEGALYSAAAIAHAQAIAEGKTGATATTTIEGHAVALIHGYPAGTVGTLASPTGIAATLATYSGFTASDAGGTATFIKGDTTSTACQVTYTQPANTDEAPVITALTACT